MCWIAPEAEPPGPKDMFPQGDTHWIGIDPEGKCDSLPASPATAVWKGRRLFEGSIGKVNVVNVGGSLSTYCGYEWVDPDPANAPNVALLAAFAPVPDRRAVTPQGTLDWVRTTFFENVHWGLKAPAIDDLRVRVLVWDTRKYDGDTDLNGLAGNNSHGAAMADLVGEVACLPSGPCAVQVETEMAMPRIRQNGEARRVDDQGDFGDLGDLPVAVSRSLQRWRDELANDPPVPFPEVLVGSLSLAFEIPDGKMTTADKAVLEALQAAVCHGAVLFAASGNVAGEGLTGLPYPAAWHTELEPTSAECDALLGVDFMEKLEKTYLKKTLYPLPRVYSGGVAGMGKAHLLRAVGGADAGGKILTKSREKACPDLAAQGLGLAVPGESDLVFTGSSVPTALVAGIAAAALAQDAYEDLQTPYLSAHPQDVLDKIVANSPSLAFGATGPCGPIWPCGDVPWIGGPEGGAGGPQNTQSSFPWADFDESQFSPWPEVCTQSICGQDPPCIRPVVSPVAEIRPQPEVYPCGGGCIVELPSPSTGLTVNPSFFIRPGMDLRYAKLLFEEGTARVRLDVTGPNDMLLDGSRHQFSLDRTALSGITLSSARVTFSALTASAGTSVTEQVLIVQRP